MCEKQIPPLRCGMTTKGRATLRLRIEAELFCDDVVVFADARCGERTRKDFAVDADGAARGTHDGTGAAVDGLHHIERLECVVCEEAIPGEDAGAPDVGRLKDREPVLCGAVLEVLNEDGLDLVALIEERGWVGVSGERGTAKQLADANDGPHG